MPSGLGQSLCGVHVDSGLCRDSLEKPLVLRGGSLWSQDPPAFTSPELGSQACITMPGLYEAGDGTPGFMHAKQALCQESHIPTSFSFPDRVFKAQAGWAILILRF